MRPTTEKDIELAAKFIKCRRSLQGLFKDEYAGKVKVYMNYVQDCMIKNNCNEIEAVLKMVTEINSSGVSTMWIMAAALEIIESEKKE